jgi:hypothetical protein
MVRVAVKAIALDLLSPSYPLRGTRIVVVIVVVLVLVIEMWACAAPLPLMVLPVVVLLGAICSSSRY